MSFKAPLFTPYPLPTPPESVSDADTDSEPDAPLRTTASPWLARAVPEAAFPSPARARRWRKFLNSEPFWLTLYFLFNLGLTLYNKLVLVRFPFPYTLTALHAFSGTIGSYLAMELGYFVSPCSPAPSSPLMPRRPHPA